MTDKRSSNGRALPPIHPFVAALSLSSPNRSPILARLVSYCYLMRLEEVAMKKQFFRRSIWLHAFWVCLFSLALLDPAHSYPRPGLDTMDFQALRAHANRLEARVEGKTADYATLRDLAITYHYMAVGAQAP